MNVWINDSSVSGVLVVVILVSLVIITVVEVAVISPDQYLVMNMIRIFVLLARTAAASSSSSSGSYDSQFIPHL